MPFAPHEIENKRFVVALRGYATHEVDAFLRAVAADYRALAQRANGGEEWSAQVGVQIEDVVHVAAGAAAKTRAEAEQTAREIVESAEREAAELLANAERECEQRRTWARERINELRRVEDRLRDELATVEAAVGLAREQLDERVGSELLAEFEQAVPAPPA
jgi:DivIVA domain-containing protein